MAITSKNNNNLHKSKSASNNDEFYTQISMIENELKYYKAHFEGKTVFCNCDDPEWSNFWLYFKLNFNELKLKKLFATHFEPKEKSYMLEMVKEGTDVQFNRKELEQNGDFRSPECIELLEQSDIVVTNPPFSLFSEYLLNLTNYKKQFLVIGNLNAVKYSQILPLLMNDKVWLGRNNGHFWFRVPDWYEEKKTDFKIDEKGQKWRRMGNICWFTNLDYVERYEDIPLYKKYSEEEFPKYDNYDAIEVPEVKAIPSDYYGVMGVPITYFNRHNPKTFKIIGVLNSGTNNDYDFGKAILQGKQKYARVLIQRIK